MNSLIVNSLVVSPFPSLKQKIQGQIIEFLQQFDAIASEEVTVSLIPVYRLKKTNFFTYRVITTPLNQIAVSLSSSVKEDLFFFLSTQSLWSVGEVGAEYWDIQFCDRAIANFLQQCLTLPPPTSPTPPPSTHHFPLQYIHQRCLSRLYLGHQQKLITLDPPHKSLLWQWCAPSPLPWQKDQKLGLTPPEQALIASIVDLTDALLFSSPPTVEKLAYLVGQSVIDFEKFCPIWGQVPYKNLQFAQSRLGLIAITQKIFLSIFWEIFAVFPDFASW